MYINICEIEDCIFKYLKIIFLFLNRTEYMTLVKTILLIMGGIGKSPLNV